MALYSNPFVPSNDPRLRRNPFVMTATGKPNPFQVSPFKPPVQRKPNLFGQDIDLSAPPPTQPGTIKPEEQPFDFATKYGEIMGNRPDRLAYRQAIESGPPEINRGKWAKIGAMIAAGGAGLGGTPAPQAAQFGISAYQMPQTRSDALYEKRTKGLAELANMEERDVSEKIRALEGERADWYNRRAEGRAVTQEQRDIAREQRAIEDWKKKNADADWVPFVDEKTGISGRYNIVTKEKQEFGKWGLNTAEEIQKKFDEADAEERAKEPGRQKERESRERIARDANQTKENVAGTNAQARVAAAHARNQATLKSLTPGQRTTQIYNDLTQMFATNRKFDGLAVDDYVDISKIPGGAGEIIRAKPIIKGELWGNDDDTDIAIKNYVNSYIEKSLKDSAPQAPAVNAPAAPNAGGTGGGGGLDTQRFIKDPKDPNHTIPNPNYNKPVR